MRQDIGLSELPGSAKALLQFVIKAQIDVRTFSSSGQ